MINEELLRGAAVKASAKLTEALEQGYDPENQHIFSDAFEKKIRKLTRRANHPLFYRGVKRVASVVLAVILAGSIWLTFDVEACAAFVGWVKEVYGTFFAYRFIGEETEVEQVRYRLGYVPEGYSETFCELSDGEGCTVYANSEGAYLQFVYISDVDSTNLFVVAENMLHSEVQVKAYQADYYESTDHDISSCMVWTAENDRTFYLSGFFNKEEMVKIAENVEKIK